APPGRDPRGLLARPDRLPIRGALPVGGRNEGMSPADRTERLLRAHLREMPLHRVLIRTIEADILSSVELPRPILDVGCGDGHFGSVLFPAGADVGLDRGASDLALARK